VSEDARIGICKHSIGARNQVGIGTGYIAGGIDALESSLGLLKSYKIRAKDCCDFGIGSYRQTL
jgi:hypothetical protein